MSTNDPSFIDAIGDSIVNPRCCDCGRSMSTPAIHQIGLPRQCGHCQQIMERRFAAEAADFMSQERPRGRRVHIVKLPEGMSAGRTALVSEKEKGRG